MTCTQALLTLLLISPCGDGGGEASAAAITQALANPSRPTADRERDAQRHPAQILAFFGIEPGMTVLDLFSGGGYFTEIVSGVVGSSGEVIAHNNRAYLEFAAEELATRYTAGRLSNVRRLVTEADDLQLPAESLDAVLALQTWHDFHYAHPETGWPSVDERALVDRLCDALKPGAILGIIDHVAPAGTDPAATGEQLHRIDPERIKADLSESCFVFDGEIDVLRNPADDYTLGVFDPAIRGRTDQVVYRFRRGR